MSAVKGDFLSLRFGASSPGVASSFGERAFGCGRWASAYFVPSRSYVRSLILAPLGGPRGQKQRPWAQGRGGWRQAPSLSWKSRASEEGSEGARLKSADVGVGRLEQALTEVVSTLGEDGAAALKVLAHRLRSEGSPARNPRSPKWTL